MIRAVSLLACLLLASIPLRGAEWTMTDLGETTIVPMATAPFPHESRADGYVRNDVTYPAAGHYQNNDVALFLPKGWDPNLGVHLLFYFHGHGNNVRQSLDQYRLREQIAESRRNVVLVFPQGPFNAPDSGGGRLEEPGAFATLATEVLAVLRAEGRIASQPLGRVVLSGHSGAFRVIAHGVMHGGLPISEVYLLDGSYGYGEEFAQWATASPEHRLRSIFTDHLAARNAWMVGRLNALGQSPLLVLEENWTPELDHAERLLFLHTTNLDHNGAVTYLGKWLSTSPLPAVQENK